MVFSATGLLFFPALYFQLVSSFTPLAARAATCRSLVSAATARVAGRFAHRFTTRRVRYSGDHRARAGAAIGRRGPWVSRTGPIDDVGGPRIWLCPLPSPRTGRYQRPAGPDRCRWRYLGNRIRVGAAMGIALLGSLPAPYVYRSRLVLLPGLTADVPAAANDSLSNIPELSIGATPATGEALLVAGRSASPLGWCDCEPGCNGLAAATAFVAGRILPKERDERCTRERQQESPAWITRDRRRGRRGVCGSTGSGTTASVTATTRVAPTSALG